LSFFQEKAARFLQVLEISEIFAIFATKNKERPIMIYTCPKCGKKMDLSTEVLINSDYKVICPQCLSQLQILGDYAYIPSDTLDLNTSVEPSHTINCPKCGHEASSNAHFCPNCGTSFDAPAPTETTPEPVIEEAQVLPPPLPDSDPLYSDAMKFLMNCTAITPMMLRDHFNITDERAAKLIQELEAGGVIGPYNNGGPRQILIPHRNMYEYSAPETQGQSRPRSNGRGCMTYMLIFLFFFILLKACTG